MEEFTEEFDIKRWLNGEEAITPNGAVVTFSHETSVFYQSSNSAIAISKERQKEGASLSKIWRMKPTEQANDGWITHWRLTDGWTPVIGGKCPAPKDSLMDIRYRNGHISTKVTCEGKNSNYVHNNDDYDIVAIRLIKQAQKTIPTKYVYQGKGQPMPIEIDDDDGWIKVIDGKMPFDVKPGTVELKWQDGFVHINDFNYKKSAIVGHCLVAVRPLKNPHMPVVKIVDPDQSLLAMINNAIAANPECQKYMIELGKAAQAMPPTLAEIRARLPRPEPIREIGQREMLRIAGLAMEGKAQGITTFYPARHCETFCSASLVRGLVK